MLVGHGERGIAGVGDNSRDDLKEAYACRVDVGTRICDTGIYLFGC
jgi:hypothetical protein